jgi:N-acetylglucosamine-6-phosphate deacetylase
MLQGRRITVKNGVCLDPEGVLAGSDLNMAAAVRNACAMLDLDLEAAIGMASANPAAFLKLDGSQGRIAEGLAADFVVLDDDLAVAETWIGGRRF